MVLHLPKDNMTLKEAVTCLTSDPDNGRILIEGNVEVTEPLALPAHLEIIGKGGHMFLQDNGALLIGESDVSLENISIEGGSHAVIIDPKGKEISHIRIRNCRLDGFTTGGITIGASADNSKMSDILIEDCEMNCGMAKDCDPDWGSAIAVSISAALAFEAPGIRNAVLENITVKKCRIRGRARCSIIGMVGINGKGDDLDIFFHDCHVRGLRILDNDVADSTDTAICAEADYINHIGCSMSDVDICGNIVEHGVFGISCTGGSPVFGNSKGAFLANTKVIGNTTIGRGNLTEGNFGIVAMGGHMDGPISKNEGCFVDRIEIANNKVTNVIRGITICGAHAVSDNDAPASLEGCYVDHADIHDNVLNEVETCFILAGAWMEGRRHDWYSHYHKRHNTWGKEITDHTVRTVTVKDNFIKNITVRHNHCASYRYYLRAAGAIGSGHAHMVGNRAVENITFCENTHELGENRQIVADSFFTDWASGEDNQIDQKLTYAISN